MTSWKGVRRRVRRYLALTAPVVPMLEKDLPFGVGRCRCVEVLIGRNRRSPLTLKGDIRSSYEIGGGTPAVCSTKCLLSIVSWPW